MNALSAIPAPVSPDFVPQTAEDLARCLASWEWRIFSGRLYKILIKENDDDEGQVAPFIPNQAQRDFLDALHYRNVILKSRQLGFTTLICILWLDHALFQANQRVAIIAHKMEDAEAFLRDKVKFAYLNMPEAIRERMPLTRDSAKELHFGHNNSAIRVAVSARSGTYQRMHVSEYGKIAAKMPEKAKEIKTGSFPTVPENGILVVESTAEGQSGEFYEIAQIAERNKARGTRLKNKSWAFHFFAWHDNPENTMNPEGVDISPAEHLYFDKVEVVMGTELSLGQRAWYITERDQGQGGDHEVMWREHPSTPKECWQRTTEGKFYSAQVAAAIASGRVCRLPYVKHVGVNTFWDIGSTDGTGVWMHQFINNQHRFIRYIEGWEEGYEHFVKELRDTGYIFDTMYLPFDADQKRQTQTSIAAPIDMLREIAPDWKWVTVPRVETIMHGISLTRQKFPTAWFDAEGCKEGIEHLSQYTKRWNKTVGMWVDEPQYPQVHREAADSLRQWAQGFDERPRKKPKRNRASGMAV